MFGLKRKKECFGERARRWKKNFRNELTRRNFGKNFATSLLHQQELTNIIFSFPKSFQLLLLYETISSELTDMLFNIELKKLIVSKGRGILLNRQYFLYIGSKQSNWHR